MELYVSQPLNVKFNRAAWVYDVALKLKILVGHDL